MLGPPLWNTFYADCRRAVEESGFQDLFFADDLNCWKSFPLNISNAVLLQAAKECQEEVHSWGAGNRVLFDAGKESVTYSLTGNQKEATLRYSAWNGTHSFSCTTPPRHWFAKLTGR